MLAPLSLGEREAFMAEHDAVYEVQAWRGGRWEIQRRYQGAAGRYRAMEEAQEIEAGGLSIRVVREVWDEETGLSNEKTVYKSGGQAPRVQRRSGQDKALEERILGLSFDAEAPSKSLFRAFLEALAIAVGATGIMAAIIWFSGTAAFNDPTINAALLVGTFALGAAVALLRPIAERIGRWERRRRERKMARQVETFDVPESPSQRARKQAHKRQQDTQPAPEPTDAIPDEPAAEAESAEEALDEPAEEEAAEGEETEVPEEDAARDDESARAAETDVVAARMLRTLGTALDTVRRYNLTFDTYVRFGLCLLLAGQEDPEGDEAAHDAFAQLLEDRLGVKHEVARGFRDKLAQYRGVEKYASMLERGQTVRRMIENGESPDTEIATAVLFWSRPRQDKTGDERWTILFTDIVSSTAITQELGDAGAQEVVRRHNRVVRTAILKHFGKEVKHTGDGIMAAFETPDEGIRAALAMLDGVAADNANAEVGLHLHIGLATGEPVIEENDFFGTVVQKAARLCASAGDDDILACDATAEAADAAGAAVEWLPAMSFKGFSGDHTVARLTRRTPDQADPEEAAAGTA